MKIFSKILLKQSSKQYFTGTAHIIATLRYTVTGSSTYRYMVVGSEDAIDWYPIKAFENLATIPSIQNVLNAHAFVYKNNKLQAFRYSFDGVNWFDCGIPSGVDTSTFYSTSYFVYYINGYYYLMLGVQGYKSADFQNWQSFDYTYSNGGSVTGRANAQTPTYGGGYLYCCFNNNSKSTLYRSSDGENWTYIQANNRYVHRGTAPDDSGFVAAYGYTGSQGFSNIYFKNYSTSYSSFLADVTRMLVSKKRGLIYARYNGTNKKSTVSTLPTFTDCSQSPVQYSDYFDFFCSGNTSSVPTYTRDLETATEFDFSSAVSSNMTVSWYDIVVL